MSQVFHTLPEPTTHARHAVSRVICVICDERVMAERGRIGDSVQRRLTGFRGSSLALLTPQPARMGTSTNTGRKRQNSGTETMPEFVRGHCQGDHLFGRPAGLILPRPRSGRRSERGACDPERRRKNGEQGAKSGPANLTEEASVLRVPDHVLPVAPRVGAHGVAAHHGDSVDGGEHFEGLGLCEREQFER